MTRYNEAFELTQDVMDAIVVYMDEEIREKVHFELAPCTNEEFLNRYVYLDPDFESLLADEFGIEL